MKDFPFFSTMYGVASLTLKQIPYSGKAYITLQDSTQPLQLLETCCDFCCAVGAKSVYATGHDCLHKFPLHTAVVLMRCLREKLPDTDAALFPVQEKTLEYFRDIYNNAMKDVHNASYMTSNDAQKVLKSGNGYFVHRNDVLMGIGIAGGERIDAVITCQTGYGGDVLLALNHALSGECAELEVATENTRAVRLYERMGFHCCSELSRWYKII